MDLLDYDEKRFKIDTPNSGLKLLMNVMQEEYCGNMKIKEGAGFSFQIHDTNRNPTFLINKATRIAPGYSISVVVKRVIYRRLTEHLGLCKNFIDTPLYTNMYHSHTKIYTLEICYMQCVTDFLLKLCNCYPPNLSYYHEMFVKKQRELNSSKSVTPCLGEDFICLKQLTSNSIDKHSINRLCPHCKEPCYETKYKIDISYSLLSKKNFRLFPTNDTQLDFDKFRKNYIFVTFSVKNSNSDLIEDYQLYTLKYLFVAIGSNICLYLGMSFVSAFEIIYLIFDLLLTSFKKFRQRNKVTKITPLQPKSLLQIQKPAQNEKKTVL